MLDIENDGDVAAGDLCWLPPLRQQALGGGKMNSQRPELQASQACVTSVSLQSIGPVIFPRLGIRAMRAGASPGDATNGLM
jgi:hypothetical protein